MVKRIRKKVVSSESPVEPSSAGSTQDEKVVDIDMVIRECSSLVSLMYQRDDGQRSCPQDVDGDADGLGEASANAHRRLSSSSTSSTGPDSKDKRRLLETDDYDPPTPMLTKKQRTKEVCTVPAVDPFKAPENDEKTGKPISISDEDAIRQVYTWYLKMLKEPICKVIARIWIRLIPNGIHVEPDFMTKDGRLNLLLQILNLIVNSKSCELPAGVISVDDLRKTTMDQSDEIFTPANAYRMVFLEELLKVARAHERYKCGETDGSYKIHIENFSDRPKPTTEHEGTFMLEKYEHHREDGQRPMIQRVRLLSSIPEESPSPLQQQLMNAELNHPSKPGHEIQLQLRPYREQAVSGQSHDQSYDQSHVISQQPYTAPCLPSNFLQQNLIPTFQESYITDPSLPDDLSGPGQYFPHAPIVNPIENTQIQFQNCQVPISHPPFQIDPHAPYLSQAVPMPIPAMELLSHGMYDKDDLIDQVPKMHQSVARTKSMNSNSQFHLPPQHSYGYILDDSYGQDPLPNFF